jgi:hypothetical protein
VKQNGRTAWPLVGRALLLYVLPLGLYLLWKWHYYGDLLPNSYYVKRSGGFNPASLDNLYWFARVYLVVPAVAAAALFVAALSKRRDRNTRLRLSTEELALGAVVVILSVVVGIQYWRSHLWMNYSYRFMAPFYPSFLLVIGIIANRGLVTVTSQARSRGWTAVIIGVAALLSLFQIYRHVKSLPQEFREARNYQKLMQNEHIPAGRFIREHLPPGEWLAVHEDAGAIPYYAGHRTIDLGLLNNRVLTRMGPSDKELVDYAFDCWPGALCITSYTIDSLLPYRRGDSFKADSRFANYQLVRKIGAEAGRPYFQFVYFRQDLIEADSILTPVTLDSL